MAVNFYNIRTSASTELKEVVPVEPIPKTGKEIADPVYECVDVPLEESDNIKMEQNPAYGTSTF